MNDSQLSNITIKDDGYNPSPAEQRLLETLLNPESVGKSVTFKCQMADISRETYYNTMKKPEFMALLNKTSVDLVREKVSNIIAASIKVAESEGARGYQDRKMLLEMAGIYREKQDININPDEPMKAMIATMSDTDILDKIKDFIKNNPEIVKNIQENDI